MSSRLKHTKLEASQSTYQLLGWESCLTSLSLRGELQLPKVVTSEFQFRTLPPPQKEKSVSPLETGHSSGPHCHSVTRRRLTTAMTAKASHRSAWRYHESVTSSTRPVHRRALRWRVSASESSGRGHSAVEETGQPQPPSWPGRSTHGGSDVVRKRWKLEHDLLTWRKRRRAFGELFWA